MGGVIGAFAGMDVDAYGAAAAAFVQDATHPTLKRPFRDRRLPADGRAAALSGGERVHHLHRVRRQPRLHARRSPRTSTACRRNASSAARTSSVRRGRRRVGRLRGSAGRVRRRAREAGADLEPDRSSSARRRRQLQRRHPDAALRRRRPTDRPSGCSCSTTTPTREFDYVRGPRRRSSARRPRAGRSSASRTTGPRSSPTHRRDDRPASTASTAPSRLAAIPAHRSDGCPATSAAGSARTCVAGLTVWALVVPQAIAYAQIAGLEPQAGLAAAAAGLVGYALLGHLDASSSSVPTSSTAAISASLVAAIAMGDAARVGRAVVGLGDRWSGSPSSSLGLARLGFIARFIPTAVQVGFLFGLGLTIIIGQLTKVLGIPATIGVVRPSNCVQFVGWARTQINWLDDGRRRDGARGAIRWRVAISPALPAALIVVVGGIVAVDLLDLAGQGRGGHRGRWRAGCRCRRLPLVTGPGAAGTRCRGRSRSRSSAVPRA